GSLMLVFLFLCVRPGGEERTAAVFRHRGVDPVSCSLHNILRYLQGLLDARGAASTLKVHLAAISASHDDE
ncbi:hypothetical protein XENOCAPTIV_025780, partial [Xenoophorus captivus]